MNFLALIIFPAKTRDNHDNSVYLIEALSRQAHSQDYSIIMKRKLDRNDVPSAETATPNAFTSGTFEDLKLDPRLRQAVLREKYLKPTPVQAAAIPLALEGRDIIGT